MSSLQPTDAAALKEGQAVIKGINKNIIQGTEPLQGVTDDDLRTVIGYIVLKRENPILGKGDSLNYEGAVKSLNPYTFKDRSSLEEVLVNHANRLSILSKKLDIEDGKVTIKEEEE